MEQKRLVVFSLLLILFVGLSMGVEADDLTDTANKLSEGVEDFTEAVDLETGNVDIDALNELLGMPKTQLEGKMDIANQWLDENLGWLKFILRAEPKISLEFFLNVYFILVAITMLILNSKEVWSPILVAGESRPYIFGIAAFLILLFSNFFALTSKLLVNILQILWTTVLPISFWIAIGVIVVAIILYFLGIPFLGKFLLKLLGKILQSKFGKGVESEVERMKEETGKVKSFFKGLSGQSMS